MKDSGTIRLDEEIIRYESSAYGTWSVPLSDVRVIGEYTNVDGPYAEDWFGVFVTAGMIYEAPVSAEGFFDVLRRLSGRLGFDPEGRLGFSTDYDSEILWPESMRRAPLFQMQTWKIKRKWWQLLLWYPDRRRGWVLAKDVVEFLEQEKKQD